MKTLLYKLAVKFIPGGKELAIFLDKAWEASKDGKFSSQDFLTLYPAFKDFWTEFSKRWR
jgi:hypothetical protein